MAHLPLLIKDLALILLVAAVTTFLFRRLKLPLVLGYVVAGLFVGPNFSFFPTIADIENIKIWAEIGVIILLFNLGLEFSFRKLLRVGGAAGVSGIFEISGMLGLGYLLGTMMGWSTMNSIFLGGIIAISSTTIIIRTFEEQGLKEKSFASLVMGMLVIEDIVAVLLLVLLSTIAVSQQFSGAELLLAVVKLVFFLCLWFLGGIFIIPGAFRWAAKWINEETLLIIALALCLGTVLLATTIGFSAALGAFIMGSVLAETTQAEQIEHQMVPVKNLFGAIFFVSVGMLIDPHLLWEYKIPVLVITLAVILGKTIHVSLGALISGQPLKQSIQAGMSMSQIGEFSFIIATLGVSLKVTDEFLYPIAVGVSVITTFTTPFMIRTAEPVYKSIEKALPQKWVSRLNRYSSGAQHIPSESDARKVFRYYAMVIGLNSIVILALMFLGVRWLDPILRQYIDNANIAHVITVVVSLTVASPFIWALTVKKPHSGAYMALWMNNQLNHGPLVVLEVTRNLLAVFYLYLLMSQLFDYFISMILTLAVLVIVLVIFSRKLQAFYTRMEKRFIRNLNNRELAKNTGANSTLSPWDAHLAYFTIKPEAICVGKTLMELGWRERFGVNIASIDRGALKISAPKRDEHVFPNDVLAVIGTDQQLELFRKEIGQTFAVPGHDDEEISLMQVKVDEHNRLKGLSILDSGIRERTNGLVVGIERDGSRILNPESNTVFEWGDIVWIVGKRKEILKL